LERKKEELERRVQQAQEVRVEASRRRVIDDLEVETRARVARTARGKWVSTKILLKMKLTIILIKSDRIWQSSRVPGACRRRRKHSGLKET
jgi:hypothetical protein